jgi:transcriptional regulator with XRE-family HTH domain
MRGVFADGESLRSVRVHQGLTQEGLADLAGLDVKTVRKAERGGRLDVSTLGRLADALETGTGDLVRRCRPETRPQARRHDAVRRWVEAWDAHDRDAVLAIYHEEATLRLPGDPTIPFHGTFRGKDQILHAYETAWDACRTDPVRREDFAIYVADDVAVLEGRKGVHLPNGEIASLRCVQLFTFDGDLVIDHRVEYDTLEFARLMGLPATGAASEDRGSSR